MYLIEKFKQSVVIEAEIGIFDDLLEAKNAVEMIVDAEGIYSDESFLIIEFTHGGFPNRTIQYLPLHGLEFEWFESGNPGRVFESLIDEKEGNIDD